MRSAILLSLAAFALAYQVTFPTQTQGWTNQGSNTLTWNRVNTDVANFAVILVNQDASILPSKAESLAAQIDGNAGTAQLNPPSAGWVIGDGYQVNLVKSENEQSTIYAQSPMFSIKASNSTSSSSVSATATVAATTIATPIVASSTDSSLNPSQTTKKNGALVSMESHQGVLAFAAILSAFLL